MAEVDAAAGEWRCRCPSDPEFDTSVNPSFFKACGRCGAKRPKPIVVAPSGCDDPFAPLTTELGSCLLCGSATPKEGRAHIVWRLNHFTCVQASRIRTCLK